MVAESFSASKTHDNISRQQMPLTFLKAGEAATVLKVRGNEEFHQHLENLGFVPGASLNIVSVQGGNTIVEVKGTQIALDSKSALKVIVS